jgi:flagellar hook-associated protein 1 FlgK
MSITGAMNAAMSGLRAAARGTEIVSSNISNALTPNYGRRGMELSALNYGTSGGVGIDRISRQMNENVVADRRQANAAQHNTQTAVDFFRRLEDATGIAGNTDGLGGRLASFEQSLITAASRPDTVERLAQTVTDARRLLEGLGQASADVQGMRSRADSQIAQEVAMLNTALQQVEQLNRQIISTQTLGGSSPALLDQRQAVLDTIGSVVPINVVPRDTGAIAIYTEGGAVLLDISAATVGFERKNAVTAYQTLDGGTLSGLTLNGQDILRTSAMGGGSLGGHFTVRDTHGVQAQSQLDALARDLVERFADPSLDTTRGAGEPGLFTDGGTPFDPVNEVGLSSRLALNTAVDPEAGGAVWRLRDGLGAISPGPTGDATLLNDLRRTLEVPRLPASGNFGGTARGSAELFSSFSGLLSTSRNSAEKDLSFTAVRLNELTQLQLSQGVNTDQELQNLLVLEQAYAANARVIQAADSMLETLTRL